MEFRLYYRGPLKSNGGPKDKQVLRRALHPQLRELWQHAPLSSFTGLLRPEVPQGDLSVIKKANGFTFAALVNRSVALVAELEVLMLRPEPPGAIVIPGGDIDNRIKTLLDALRAPLEPTALPPGDGPQPGEDPFHVLLEDDSLVTRLEITADRLLDRLESPNDVVLVIKVRTKQLKVLMGTIGLA